jgi:hypothetical protein
MSAVSINVSVTDLFRATKKKRFVQTRHRYIQKKCFYPRFALHIDTWIEGTAATCLEIFLDERMQISCLSEIHSSKLLSLYYHPKVIGIVMSILSFDYRYEKDPWVPIRKEYTIHFFVSFKTIVRYKC